MNINGRDITAADLVNQIDMLHSGWCKLMYKYISTDKTFLKDMPGTNYKKRQLLNELIEHFTETKSFSLVSSSIYVYLVLSLSSKACTIERPSAYAKSTGTAFPTCLYCAEIGPRNCKASGKDCSRAASRGVI